MCERQETELRDSATFFPSTYINPCLSILLSCSFFWFSFILLLSNSIVIWYNTCIYSFNLATQLNISSREYAPLGQSSREQHFLLIFFILMYFFFPPGRPRGMTESPSGRNLPLAVSMTTSQSSTPAAARTAHPPGGFGSSVCVCVYEWVAGLINVAFEGQRQYFCVLASDS